jgi:NADPH:quinone reductase-like Zn-dependent oxidoreductase
MRDSARRYSDETMRRPVETKVPTYTHGTWAEKVVVPHDKVVAVAPDADPLQPAMLPINSATGHVMLNRFVDLKPGDWVGQRARTRPSDAL